MKNAFLGEGPSFTTLPLAATKAEAIGVGTTGYPAAPPSEPYVRMSG